MMTASSLENLVPIREVSRLTGVATVTLRAWERRYGLLKPTRTPKGHRLYSTGDIQRVRDIQNWLARGVAVGKICGILASAAQAPDSDNSVWEDLAAQLLNAVTRLDRTQVERQLAGLMPLYPMPLIADRVLAPLLHNLQHAEYGTGTRQALLKTLLLEQLYSGQSRLRQTACGPQVLVVRLPGASDECLSLMLVNSLLISGYRAYYLDQLPAEELVLAVEQLQIEAVILFGDTASAMASVQHVVDQWRRQLTVPLLVYGPAVGLLDRASNAALDQWRACVEQRAVLVELARELPVAVAAGELDAAS